MSSHNECLASIVFGRMRNNLVVAYTPVGPVFVSCLAHTMAVVTVFKVYESHAR